MMGGVLCNLGGCDFGLNDFHTSITVRFCTPESKRSTNHVYMVL